MLSRQLRSKWGASFLRVRSGREGSRFAGQDLPHDDLLGVTPRRVAKMLLRQIALRGLSGARH